MIILTIDTCESYCSTALIKNGVILAGYSENIGRGHAEKLLPAIESILDSAQENWADIDKIAVITGPGTFTGLRIGLSVARGLAISLKIPCVGISALECLASQAKEAGIIHACIHGRGETSYHQKFIKSDNETLKSLSDAASLPNVDIAQMIDQENSAIQIIGSGAATFAGNTGKFKRTINCGPCDMNTLGVLAQSLNKTTNPATPHYLRAPDATKAKSIFPVLGQ
jgi:tRNA threonylcarbamoyladenosine biosynthesis protein TsaB